MHAGGTVEVVLQDQAAGIAAARIARRRQVPRSTIRDWCAGRLPGSARASDGDPWVAPEFPEEAYCRLLGTYLGDGCINAEPRTMVLRIACDAAYPGLIADTVNDLRALRPNNAVVDQLGWMPLHQPRDRERA